jgi:hypothetical protein
MGAVLGDVAQLARAPALQAGGRGFESHRLHSGRTATFDTRAAAHAIRCRLDSRVRERPSPCSANVWRILTR